MATMVSPFENQTLATGPVETPNAESPMPGMSVRLPVVSALLMWARSAFPPGPTMLMVTSDG